MVAATSTRSSSSSAHAVPHVVLVPIPAQGHINPAMALARYLAASGICVTLVYSARAHSLIMASTSSDGSNISSGGLAEEGATGSMIHIEVIGDGMPTDARDRVTVEDVGASLAIMRNGLEELLQHKLMAPHVTPNYITVGVAKPCCLIVDSILAWGPDVAHQVGLPWVALWTSSASSLSAGIHVPDLLARGYVPALDADARERKIDFIAGLTSLSIEDLPPLFTSEDGLKSPPYQFIRCVCENAKSADRVLVNTVHGLEPAVVKDLRDNCGVQVCPVGPLFLMQAKSNSCQPASLSCDSARAASGASLLEEDHSCLPWLDKQAKCSVIYVSFGSVAYVAEEVYAEVAHGLEASGERFLWVIRLDALTDKSMSVVEFLPQGFVERTANRGMVIAWAPQLAVLAHPSVGGFLTHCGWNSVLESLSYGVPMLGFPQQGDQCTNMKHIVHDWKVGLPLVVKDGHQAVQRTQVQSAVTALLRGPHALRDHALACKELVLQALHDTSETHLQKLVHDLHHGHFIKTS